MFFKRIFRKNRDEKILTDNLDSHQGDVATEKDSGKRRTFMYGKKRYIPIFILSVMIVVLIFVRAYFNNDRVKNIVEDIVYSSLNRKLNIDSFKYGLLFPKIEMNGVTLYNSTNFNEHKNITIDTLRLRFSLFSLFAIKLHIKEFTIDNLYLDLFTDKYGNWNLPDMPPSEPKIETNNEPFDLKKLDFLKIKAEIENIRINNLSVKADSVSSMSNEDILASISNFNIHVDANTKRFSLSEAVSLEAPKILNTLSLKTFLSEEVLYKDSSTFFKDSPIFNLSIVYPKDIEREIELNFNFDVENPYFVHDNVSQNEFQASSSINIRYSIDDKDVYIDNISMKLFKDEILKIVASATDILGDDMGFNIDEAWAKIDLSKIKIITDSFMPSLNIKMKGLINLDVQKSSGTVSAIDNNLTLNIKSVNFDFGRAIRLSNINSTTTLGYNFDKKSSRKDDIKLKNNTSVDRILLDRQAPIMEADIEIRAVSSLNGALNVLGTFDDNRKKSDTIVYIDRISAKYISSAISGYGILQFDDNTDLNIEITNLPITLFTGGLARGALSLKANIFGELLTDVNAKIDGDIRNFSYNLSGDVSSTAQARLEILANANVIKQSVEVSDFNLYLDRFLTLKANASLEDFGLGKGYINVHTLRLAPYSLQRWLSPNFAALIEGLPFQDDINITSVLGYTLSLDDTFATVTNFTTLMVTEEKYNLRDVTMKVDSDINFGNDMYANIRMFSIDSPKNNLRVRLNGLATADLTKADIKYEIGVNTKSLYLPFGVEIGGLFNLLGTLSNNIAIGNLESKSFFASMKSSDNMSLYLEDFNANSDYNFNLTATKENVRVSKQLRYTPLVTEIPNIFFKQLRIYLKIPPFIDDSIRLVDFSSTLKVQGHGFIVQNLKSSLYIGGEKFDDVIFFQSISNNTAPRRGAIHIPWLNLDLGSFNMESIKYDMRVLSSDINFKYLLPVDSRDKINDEKLLVNFTGDIAGIGLNPLNSIRLNTFFVGISKMSTEFSKFLIEMIRPINPGISTVENIVQFGYDPNSVEFSISANKVFTTFYFRDQNLDKPNQQKLQLIAFEGDKFGLEPMSFSDVVSYLEGDK